MHEEPTPFEIPVIAHVPCITSLLLVLCNIGATADDSHNTANT